MKMIIPKIRWFLKNELKTETDIFQHELRSIFVILFGTALIFQVLGLHSIVAGFFAGLVLSDSVKSLILREKLRAISYGIFIPVFFVVIGAQTDFNLLISSKTALILTVVLIVSGIFSKVLSGYIGGRMAKMNNRESMILSSATIPQLSTTLAVAFTGFELGIFNQEIVTAIVAMSIFTTVIGTFLIGYTSRKYIREEVEFVEGKVLSHYD